LPPEMAVTIAGSLPNLALLRARPPAARAYVDVGRSRLELAARPARAAAGERLGGLRRLRWSVAWAPRRPGCREWCRTVDPAPLPAVAAFGSLYLHVSQLDAADRDDVVVAQLDMLDTPTIDKGAIEAPVVEDLRAAGARDNDRVAVRYGAVVEMQVGAKTATDVEHLLAEGYE
jgi:hypothetical protein